jgi:hypothetical protein
MSSNEQSEIRFQEESPCQTFAEALYYFTNPELRLELERFRKQYELIHGQTDLTLRYTSTWPRSQQEWLIENDMRRYFEGLPPFVQAYFKSKLTLAARLGNLDDMPSHLVSLYLSGNMRVG